MVHSRFERSGDPTDLDEAIGLHRRAADIGHRHPATAVLRTALGAALLSRFFLAGNPDDLDAAVANCRLAADQALEESPHFTTCRANLGSALAACADWSGSNPDLDAAVTACRDLMAGSKGRHKACPGPREAGGRQFGTRPPGPAGHLVEPQRPAAPALRPLPGCR